MSEYTDPHPYTHNAFIHILESCKKYYFKKNKLDVDRGKKDCEAFTGLKL